MDVSLYTQCSIADFLHLDDDPNCWRESPLTYPPVACVVLSCLKGAKWDLTNESILIREEGKRRINFVRIERKKRVRICDVIDELRGVLVPGIVCVDDREMMLNWQFGDTQVRQSRANVL
jgi:hypothetical protein